MGVHSLKMNEKCMKTIEKTCDFVEMDGKSFENAGKPMEMHEEFKGLYFEGHVEVFRKGQNLTISVSLSSELYPAQNLLDPA